MKPLLLSIDDYRGGAARAAYRLHQGLRRLEVDSQMFVQFKFSDDSTVLSPTTKLGKGIAQLRPFLDSLPVRLYRQRKKTVFSCEWLPETLNAKVFEIAPDILNLHWVCDGYLQIETIAKFRQPIVWTMHDMWPFTGGCHYSDDCDRYTQSCGACPQLHSSQNSRQIRDLSRWIWQRKAKAWKNLNLTAVAPSRWLAKCAETSALFHNFRIEVIPNGLDTERYKPINRNLARQWLNLPQDKQLVLFGAVRGTSDRRKGFHLLQSALKKLSQTQLKEAVELVIFGSSEPQEPIDLGFKSHYFGVLNDDISLALIYAAADVFVAPSIQENLSNTVLEAMACGTPCVAFNIGGMPDMVEHLKNGYLAQPFETQDLADGIASILGNQEWHQKLSDSARKKIEREFTLRLQATRYQALFAELLANRKY